MSEVTKKPIYVIWQDASNLTGWSSFEEALALEPAVIHSLGWLLHEDAARIVLTHSLDPTDGENLCALTVPKGWVLELRHFPEINL